MRKVSIGQVFGETIVTTTATQAHPTKGPFTSTNIPSIITRAIHVSTLNFSIKVIVVVKGGKTGLHLQWQTIVVITVRVRGIISFIVYFSILIITTMMGMFIRT